MDGLFRTIDKSWCEDLGSGRSYPVEKGASVLVKTCAGIKGDESVLIVTDELRKPIARAVEQAALALGAHVSLVTRAPSQLDNAEPEPAVAERMQQAEVIFLVVTHALSHTRATRAALQGGAKVVSMSAFTQRQMREGGGCLRTSRHANHSVTTWPPG